MHYFAVLVFLLVSCGTPAAPPDAAPDLGSETSDTGAAEMGARDVGVGGSWTEFDEDTRLRLQAQLDAAVANHGLPGLAMAVFDHPNNRLWSSVSGYVDPARTELREHGQMFRIGSVTKTFTVALIMQLVDEGTIALDDAVEQWVPGYFDGEGIRIQHLASNSSGIASYNYVGSFDDTMPWTPDELVQWAVDHSAGLEFQPGSRWQYSNTNFVLLGMIAEAATGRSYADLVDERLLQPLRLADTYVAGSGDPNPRVVASYDSDGTSLSPDPSFGWAAGAIVSTPADLAVWGGSLYGGDVLSVSGLEAMTTTTFVTDEIEYGLGTFIEDDGTDAIYGHTGGIGGFLTYMYSWRKDGYTVVVSSNVQDVDLRDLSAYAWSVMLDFDHP